MQSGCAHTQGPWGWARGLQPVLRPPSLSVPCSAAGGQDQAKHHPRRWGRGFGAGMGQAWGLWMGLAAWGEPKAMLGLSRSNSHLVAVGDVLPPWQEENSGMGELWGLMAREKWVSGMGELWILGKFLPAAQGAGRGGSWTEILPPDACF